MSKKIIIVGKAASGKNELASRYIEKGYTYAVFHTTRPKREGEVDGVDYYFIDEEKLLSLKSSNQLICKGEWNEWSYGLTIHEWEKADIVELTPSYLEQLPVNIKNEYFVIYLDISEKVRRKRLEQRNDVDIVERRLNSDEKDFKDFKDWDLRITNSNF